jgi:hypothetical protein
VAVLIVEIIYDVLEFDFAVFQKFSQLDDVFDSNAALQKRIQGLLFAGLNSLGNLHLAFPRKKGDATHLFQIHLHRIRDPGRHIRHLGPEILFLNHLLLPFLKAPGFLNLLLGRLIDDHHIQFFEHHHEVINGLRGDHVVGQLIVQFFVGDVSLILADIDESLEIDHV